MKTHECYENIVLKINHYGENFFFYRNSSMGEKDKMTK